LIFFVIGGFVLIGLKRNRRKLLMLNPDDFFFPDARQIEQHAVAFAQMMFAHTAFEQEVSALQDAITAKSGFGEQRRNQWNASERSERMVKLIKTHRGELQQTDEIAKLITEAENLCKERNFLAHGTWWCFNRTTSAIVVRGGTRWDDPEIPPEQREYTATKIVALADAFKAIEIELYKLRREIKPPPSPTEMTRS
jgi:hypothetical protein